MLFLLSILNIIGMDADCQEGSKLTLFNQIQKEIPIIGGNNKTIEGDLIINPASLSRDNISSEIILSNSKIRGKIRIEDLSFHMPIKFENVIFNETVDVLNCTIDGPIIFNGCKFLKDTNFIEVKFSGDFESKGTIFLNNVSFIESIFNNITIGSGQFYAFADFSKAIFGKDSSFAGTRFRDQVSFNSAKFNTCNFEGSNLSNPSYIDTIFNGAADFRGSKFYNYSCFRNASFIGPADFSEVRFYGIAYFKKLNFSQECSFYDSQFIRESIFTMSNFNLGTDFESAKFNGNAVFDQSEFNGDANFKGTVFTGDADFSESIFMAETYFNNAKFLNNDSKVILHGCEFFNDATFEGASINGTLNLENTKYNKLHIRWYNISKFYYDDAAYLLLVENFKKLALYEDADKCYYKYRVEHRQKPWNLAMYQEKTSNKTLMPMILIKFNDMFDEPFRKKIDWLLDILYAYGVEPIRPVYYSIFFIVLFTFIWRSLISEYKPIYHNLSQGSSLNDILKRTTAHLKNIIRSFNMPFILSVHLFLSGARFIIEPPELPESINRDSRLVKSLSILERLLGGLFLALFFLAVSRTIIRS